MTYGGGGPTAPGIALYQLSFDFGPEGKYPNTTWGEVDVTFEPTGNVLYFNMRRMSGIGIMGNSALRSSES